MFEHLKPTPITINLEINNNVINLISYLNPKDTKEESVADVIESMVDYEILSGGVSKDIESRDPIIPVSIGINRNTYKYLKELEAEFSTSVNDIVNSNLAVAISELKRSFRGILESVIPDLDDEINETFGINSVSDNINILELNNLLSSVDIDDDYDDNGDCCANTENRSLKTIR